MRLQKEYRDSVKDIREIVLDAPGGIRVPLGNLAKIEVREGPAQINRDMGKRRIVVGLNVKGRDLGGFVAELQRKVAKQVPLPPGYYIEWGGQFQNMERALHSVRVL